MLVDFFFKLNNHNKLSIPCKSVYIKGCYIRKYSSSVRISSNSFLNLDTKLASFGVSVLLSYRIKSIISFEFAQK